ncbi:MAG: 4-alpha-glucanotransferase [Candidatus Humimicrobiaceae bacterium]
MARANGILLHISSLPSPYGIGDFGKYAYRFVDFLNETKQKYWQMLPLNPTSLSMSNSPYSSNSAFAGNILFINPTILQQQGLVDKEDLESIPTSPYVDYHKVTVFKKNLLKKAFSKFKQNGDFYSFCQENSSWLNDYSLFLTIKSQISDKSWDRWPVPLRDREENSLKEIEQEFSSQINYYKFCQYLFFRQWHSLYEYCHQKDIKIIGDIPIYICFDSSDVWANPNIFKLSDEKRPLYMAGVPPDYYSETGQLWGNPVFNWDELKNTGYKWWIDRLSHNFKFFDISRIDHFRGLVAYWQIPAGEENAINGKWAEVPFKDFFNVLTSNFPNLPIIAEDLGIITEDVREVMKTYNLPGMKVLLFAFSEDDHPYMPHNYPRNSFVYTGTHDNNTAKGWFETEATDDEKKRLSEYLGKEISSSNVSLELARLAMMSVSDNTIIPMQDLLGLGKEARMNFPSKAENNWRWKLSDNQLEDSKIKENLYNLTKTYGRI